MSSSRQLAAIMFTDIVGYTKLMGQDEEKGFAILEQNRKLQKPLIEAHNGRCIKEIGDGILATFTSASEAVNAATKIMEYARTNNAYQIRIGIHSAEVLFEDNDVFGDGVNVAARIQSAAPSGSILISEAVQKNIANNKNFKTNFVREEQLKNVSHPVKLFQLLTEGCDLIEPTGPVSSTHEKSIAVLPFVNRSSDPEQEYFSDGISEEIINMLAQVPELKVIGRTSSFSFKDRKLDLKQIAEQLQVSHLLEGSVRKSGNKLRITAQLVESTSGFHLYSEKFDRELDDIFAIQDEISEAILEKIKIQLLPDKKADVFKKYTTNLEAYQYYLKGIYHFNRYAWADSILAFQSAIQTDPEYAIAYAQMAICFADLAYFDVDRIINIKHAINALEKARILDSQCADFQYALGRMKFWYYWDFQAAVRALKEAIRINPNSVEAHQQLGSLYMKLRNYEKGDVHLNKAAELDPFSLMSLLYIGAGYYSGRAYDKALEYGKLLVALEDRFSYGHFLFGLSSFCIGEIENGLKEMERSVELEGNIFNYSHLAGTYATAAYTGKAKEILQIMDKLSGNRTSGYAYFGFVYASLGEYNEACKYFNLAIDRREGHMLHLPIWIQSHFPGFTDDPGSHEILEKIGLPP